MKRQMSRQGGFGVIAAIVLLVIFALLATAVVSLSATQSTTEAQDALGAKAWQTARAGNEWGLFLARQKQAWPSGTTCDAANQATVLNLTADNGFQVTVTCAATVAYNEGESSPGVAQTVRVYQITATATSALTVASPGFVERRRVVFATD